MKVRSMSFKKFSPLRSFEYIFNKYYPGDRIKFLSSKLIINQYIKRCDQIMMKS